MFLIELDVYEYRDKCHFDPDIILKNLQQTFPQAEVVSGDQLKIRYEKAKETLAKQKATPENAKKVLKILERNIELYGPAYLFFIPKKSGKIQGLIRKYDITFQSSKKFRKKEKQIIFNFLNSFNIGTVKIY